MIKLTEKEIRLIEYVRRLGEYQKIEIKMTPQGQLVFTMTTNERHIIYE